jgi:alpha-galactosidase
MIDRFRWWLTAFLLISPWLISPQARAGIQYDPERKVWVLQAGEETYAFGVNERGELQSIYWGPRIARDADFLTPKGRPEVASFDLSTTTTPQEYPGWGAELYNEPALKATYADGNRDVVLHFVQQHIDGDTLEVELKDIGSALEVHLYYRVYASAGILQRWSRIVNRTDQAITLESAQSAAWSLPQGEGYGWHYMTGHWGAEWQIHSEALQTGSHVIESRRGSTSHQANRRERTGVVWSTWLEWQLAHHRGADGDAAITRNRRIQSL